MKYDRNINVPIYDRAPRSIVFFPRQSMIVHHDQGQLERKESHLIKIPSKLKKILQLHLDKYRGKSTPEDRKRAIEDF